MAAITTLYDVNQVVYQVDAAKGVRKGTVSATNVALRPSGIPAGYTTTITYTIHLTGTAQGIVDIAESTLYDDVDLALAAYKVLVG